MTLMRDYTSLQSDWSQYAHSNSSKQYTRNLVMEVPNVFNLLLLVWTPGKSSPIHDHVNSHCVMKILSGSLVERRFAWPLSPVKDTAVHKMVETSNALFESGKVAYICDSMGLHSIENPSSEEYAYSLHLYTPPNAAMRGCHVFEKETGKASHVQQCPYDSVSGKERSQL